MQANQHAQKLPSRAQVTQKTKYIDQTLIQCLLFAGTKMLRFTISTLVHEQSAVYYFNIMIFLFYSPGDNSAADSNAVCTFFAFP